MLTEEQINSLMLDKDLGSVCEQVLGTRMVDIATTGDECTLLSIISKEPK